ncbi:esterase [Ideonella livida]|uniref:Esterase n=1 Tax=Ideonella livida TaxID=2707176 RepID=A0A7C9TM83_9BURK|nr:esterase [Ideonella livida]NDY91466.1 esterase [Ideonella livida]
MSDTSPPSSPPARVLQWRPAQGDPAQMFILLHGVGANADDMRPLASALQAEFPQAMVLAVDGFDVFDGGPTAAGRQWFSLRGVTEENRPARVATVLPALAHLVRSAQAMAQVSAQATALVGFSQGAICGLALAQAHDGLVGRMLAFSGRYAALPEQAPRETTLHFLHGAQDTVIPAQHARAALQRLGELRGDATLDVDGEAGHEISSTLVSHALFRLRHHIPQRTWDEALNAAPPAPGQPLH